MCMMDIYSNVQLIKNVVFPSGNIDLRRFRATI